MYYRSKNNEHLRHGDEVTIIPGFDNGPDWFMVYVKNKRTGKIIEMGLKPEKLLSSFCVNKSEIGDGKDGRK